MALALLVVGALMSGAGLYAVIYGYSIIQVEEGWASVISGTTLITGGILTIALGLVLRTLRQVKASLQAPIGADPEVRAPVADPPLSPLEGSLTPVAVPSPPAPELEPVEHDPPATTAEYAPGAPPERPGPIPPVRPASNEAEVASPAPVAPPVSHADLVPPAPPAETASDPIFATPRPADDYKLETPSTDEHDLRAAVPLPVPAPEPESPAMDDWLDRAFAELDRDNPPLYRPPDPPPRKPISGPTPHTSDLEPAVATPSDHHAAEASALPTPSPPDVKVEPSPLAAAAPPSAVIGRYESDGTTYVMYADGSIEAQSAAGVYRFSSMAELKSFIER